MVIGSILIHYDAQSKQLSTLADSQRYRGETIDGVDAMVSLRAKDALNNISMIVSDENLSYIRGMNLYESTKSLSAPCNLYVSATDLLHIFYSSPQFSKYNPANIEKTIDAMWGGVGSRAPAERTVLQQKKDAHPIASHLRPPVHFIRVKFAQIRMFYRSTTSCKI